MLDRLARGDVVTVTRIDRLARSTFDGIVNLTRSSRPAVKEQSLRKESPRNRASIRILSLGQTVSKHRRK